MQKKTLARKWAFGWFMVVAAALTLGFKGASLAEWAYGYSVVAFIYIIVLPCVRLVVLYVRGLLWLRRICLCTIETCDDGWAILRNRYDEHIVIVIGYGHYGGHRREELMVLKYCNRGKSKRLEIRGEGNEPLAIDGGEMITPADEFMVRPIMGMVRMIVPPSPSLTIGWEPKIAYMPRKTVVREFGGRAVQPSQN